MIDFSSVKGFFVACCATASLYSAAGNAATFFAFDSSPGEIFGQGASTVITSADASISAYCDRNRVHAEISGASANWSLDFAVGGADAPSTGVYEQAKSYPGQGPRWNGIRVSANSVGCSVSSGRFVVRELVCGASQNLTRLAVDFEHHCGTTAAPALLGYLRVNSDLPKVVLQPTASAGLSQRVREGSIVRLDGSQTRGPSGISSVLWSQTSGPAVVLSSATVFTPQFVAPDVPPGESVLEFQIKAFGPNGLADSNRTKVTVLDVNSPTTIMQLQSQAGDTVGNGQTVVITDLYDTLYGICSPTQGDMYVQTTGPWEVIFMPPPWQQLQRGLYAPIASSPSDSSELPKLQVHTGYGPSCGPLFGQFVVHEYECDRVTGVGRFAVDVLQRCGSNTAPKLTGQLRWQSAVPLVVTKPTASAGPSQFVTEGQTVQLDGSRSFSPAGILAVNWTQLSGALAVLTSTSILSPTFVAPAVPAGGSTLVFELRVTGQDGQSDTHRVEIQVRDYLDPQMLFTVDTPAGRTLELTSRDSTFTGHCGASTLSLTADREARSYTTSAYLQLQAPLNQALQLGVYDNLNDGGPTPTRASATGAGFCNLPSARVVVRDLECDTLGKVVRAAVDIESTCPDTLGSLVNVTWRYKSPVPTPYAGPTASAGIDQYVLEGQNVSLDGSRSSAPRGIANVQWRQIGGAPGAFGDASALQTSFTAPLIPDGIDMVVLELTVRDLQGDESTARTRLFVRDNMAPRNTLRTSRSRFANAAADSAYYFSESDTLFSGACSETTQLTSVSWNSFRSGEIFLKAEPGQPLSTRVYPQANSHNPQLPSQAFYSNSAYNIACSSTGRYVVRDFACTGTTLQRLALDYEDDCADGGAARYTFLRFNSAVPEIVASPTANAGIDRTVREGERVTLDGNRSFGPVPFASTVWRQTSGPAVTLVDGDNLAPAFTAPTVAPGGTQLVFELTVTAVDGLIGTDTVTLQVLSAQAPKSFLTIISQPGDYVGASQIFTLDNLTGILDTSCSMAYASLDATGPSNRWGLTVRGGSTPLQAGLHGTDVSVGGDGRGCTSSAEFDLREFSCGVDGRIAQLAVDAINRCGENGPVLRAFARINSVLPLPPFVDRGCRIALLSSQLTPSGNSTLLLRGLLGMRGSQLFNGLLPPYASISPPANAVNAHFDYACALLPPSVGPSDCSMDLDGDGTISVTTDGLLAARLLLGVAPETAILGTIGNGAIRTSWAQIQQYMQTCHLAP